MEETTQNKELIVVFGATGYLGYHIVKELLINENSIVRIVARSSKKVNDLFSPTELVKIESIVEMDTCHENKESIKKAFKPCIDGTKVSRVISVLASSKMFDSKQEYKSSIVSNKVLIDTCEDIGINQFVYISSMLISKAYKLPSILINSIIPNAFSHKVQVENYLKLSKLNYLIIRPGGLKDKYESKLHKVRISQEDKGPVGFITRASTAKVTIEAMFDSSLPSHTSVDCFSQRGDMSKEFNWNEAKESWGEFREERALIQDNHQKAQKIVKLGLGSILVAGVAFLAKNPIQSFISNKFGSN